MISKKLAIIGSGPAGYTAAVYASRAQLEPVLFTGIQSGGQLMWTSDIENFPGFPKGIGGPDLMQAMRDQAARFGTTIVDDLVSSITRKEDQGFELVVGEETYQAQAVIIATGATAIMLGAPGEQDFLGRGVSTCAVCDAAFYRDKDTIVVGGGDSAMEDALALTKFAKTVTVVHRRDSFRASKIMQDRVLNHPKVKVIWNAQITKVTGADMVTGVTIKTPEGEQNMPIDGVFVAIGHKPASELFKDLIAVDEKGYVVTRQSATKLGAEAAQAAVTEEGLLAFPTQTSVPGMFAAGDVVDVRYRQAITSAGQGCQAALDAERWLEAQPESK